MQDLKITMVQANLAWEDPASNISKFSNMLSGMSVSADLILLPEMFNTGFTMNAERNFEEMNGISMEWMAGMAAEKNSVVSGSLIIRDEGRYYNRLIWMRPDGSYDFYDKKHLFRMGDEHLYFSPGNKKLTVELKGWKIMPMICYDLRFPVWSKSHFGEGKYHSDLLLYIASWPSARSRAWDILIRARAIENMVYTAGLNRTGTDGRGYEYAGGSVVAGPDGEIIAHAQNADETLISCTLTDGPLNNIRQKLGVGFDWDKFELR